MENCTRERTRVKRAQHVEIHLLETNDSVINHFFVIFVFRLVVVVIVSFFSSIYNAETPQQTTNDERKEMINVSMANEGMRAIKWLIDLERKKNYPRKV